MLRALDIGVIRSRSFHYFVSAHYAGHAHLGFLSSVSFRRRGDHLLFITFFYTHFVGSRRQESVRFF